MSVSDPSSKSSDAEQVADETECEMTARVIYRVLVASVIERGARTVHDEWSEADEATYSRSAGVESSIPEGGSRGDGGFCDE